jgi:hypothetical protein
VDTGRSVAVDGSLGSYPYANTALSNTLVPILGVRPQGGMPNQRNIYTAVIGNPSAAVAYLQILSPTISGNVTGQASFNPAGAQTGVQVTLPPTSAALVTGTYFLDVRGRAESLTVTVTAGPTLNTTDGSNVYTVSFTTTVVHATSGPIALMGGMTLGTTAPTQSYGPVPAGQTLPLLFGEMGQVYTLGFAIAGTTGPANAAAPATALVVNLGSA